MEKNGSHRNAASSRNSPVQQLTGASSRSSVTNYHGKSASSTPLRTTTNGNMFEIITVSRGTGLCLKVVGGVNRPEGPLVYVQEVIPGGDCHKDGRLRPGDQLVSINKQLLLGLTYEEATSIINEIKPRSSSAWEISFIRPDVAPIQLNTAKPFSTLLTSCRGELQHTSQERSQVLSPDENIASKMSMLNMEAGFKEREQASAISANSTTDVAAGAAGPSWSDDYGQQRASHISLNPAVRLEANKLEMALNYLGIQPTKEEKEVLRQQLPKDSKGSVSFGDFAQVARNLFCLQLDGPGTSKGSATFSTCELARSFHSQFVSSDPLALNEMEVLRKERYEAFKEICKLKEELARSERARKQLAEELQTTKREAKGSVEEARILRSRLHLAEAAQKQARGMEMDYEEVIHLLETEIADLKNQLAGHSGQNKDCVHELKKRITVLDCQLRKSEAAKKAFEGVTEKILRFLEAAQEALRENSTSMTNLSDRKAMFPSESLFVRMGRNERTGPPPSLAMEARQLARSLRAILEADCLPYGWEEACTADGLRYFINHVTQTTSWIHPVTNVFTFAEDTEDEDDSEPSVSQH